MRIDTTMSIGEEVHWLNKYICEVFIRIQNEYARPYLPLNFLGMFVFRMYKNEGNVIIGSEKHLKQYKTLEGAWYCIS